MQINALIAVLALVPLASSCKCFPYGQTGNQVDISSTHYCCSKWKGQFDDWSSDCNAHSIKNKLNSFLRCCDEHFLESDCYVPRG